VHEAPNRTVSPRESSSVRFITLILLLVVSTTLCRTRLYAQDLDFSKLELPEGLESKPDEVEAWIYTQLNRYIRARELAEVVLKKRPSSYIAHLVLGLTQHYAEANFPRAVYHLDRALRLYEQQHDVTKPKNHPWRWHVAILKELSAAYGAMEHFSRQLGYMARYNQLYDPDMVAERAWPLMKLRRFSEARLAANLGLKTNREDQREIALNALCAIEFEQGNDQTSYQACKNAVDDAALVGRSPSSVDLTNYAEAARSMLRLDLAERIALDATVATVSWYANPWLELSELYMRQGRFEDALSALKEIPQYRAIRPPHVRDSDRNENRRALASFLLLLGRPGDALAFTSKASVAPDRRAHNSRDPLQDQLVIAMLDRRTRLVAAEICMERASAEPLLKRLYKWPLAWLKAGWLRFQAWRSAAKAKRLLKDDHRLTGVFQVGTSEAAVVPPWLMGELISIMGAGIVREAVDRARKEDRRKGAGAYYDALFAEVAAAFGKDRRVLELSERAIGTLGQGEALLRARVRAIAAVAAMRLGQTETALEYYETALRNDRGVFRRLGLPIPVRFTVRGGETAHQIENLLKESPRLDVSDSGFELRIEAKGSNGSVCMIGAKGAVFDCTRVVARKNENAVAFASRLARQFNSEMFSPRVDLTRTDINSLDGTNIAARDTIDSVFDDPE
jgi:tetratricopeptide (TPR) repeat protein